METRWGYFRTLISDDFPKKSVFLCIDHDRFHTSLEIVIALKLSPHVLRPHQITALAKPDCITFVLTHSTALFSVIDLPKVAKKQNAKQGPSGNQCAAGESCVEAKKEVGGVANMYLCSICKNRFHLACQQAETKVWNSNRNARKRACEACRQK